MRGILLWIAVYTGCAASVIVSLTAGGTVYIREGIAWTARETKTAAVFFVQSITVTQIQNNYRGVFTAKLTSSAKPAGGGSASGGRVRILIVPGHRPEAGGTVFGGLYERDIVVDIADALAVRLSQNPHYDVMVARTKSAWHPVLQSYFDTHALEIETFRQSQALQMADHIANGRFILEEEQVYHNTAPTEAALQLYGINKWTSDNGYDITLHLHLNDYARSRARSVGEYNGFAVYVPDRQYSNAAASRVVGSAIAARLAAYHATSTLPQEDAGVVEDQTLIAVGSNNSANGAALLIEYGYLYEPQFQESSVRPAAVAEYAFQTYLGLQDFFKDPLVPTSGSISFPYEWAKVSGKRGEKGPGIYALQAALRSLGYYPPSGKSFSECPISGVARVCTRSAIMEYQRAHDIETTGTLGPRTRTALSREAAEPAEPSFTSP